MTELDLFVPLRTSGGGNNREHHFARHERVARERKAVWVVWPRRNRNLPVPPVDVHMVRVKPSGLMLDDDNLRMALKSVRDQVADELDVDDGDTERIRFTYGQELGEWGVRIAVRARRT